MDGSCSVGWLCSPTRQFPPRAATITILIVQTTAAFRWPAHPPSPGLISGLLIFSAVICFLVLVRMPPVFEFADDNPDRLGLAFGANAWLTLFHFDAMVRNSFLTGGATIRAT